MPRPYNMVLERGGVGSIPPPTSVSPANMDVFMASDYGLTWDEMQSAIASLNQVPSHGGDYRGDAGVMISSLANVAPPSNLGLFIQKYGMWLVLGGLGLLLLKRR